MLIQGTNAPIIIEFEESVEDIVDVSIALIKDDAVLKRWGKSDVRIEGTNIYCPMEQAETMDLPSGSATLEIKYTDANGEVNFIEKTSVRIEKRIDNTILVEGYY